MDVDKKTRERVVEMYLSGSKLIDITRETKVPRSSIYWILQKYGVDPERIARPSKETISVDMVLAQLRNCEAERGRLLESLEREKALNEALLERLSSATPKQAPSPRARKQAEK